ncbi:MAG: hypothetical protein L0H41_14440 [Microlunatus sp.]|nr:hypothetical protein [Microlunatus sp.]
MIEPYVGLFAGLGRVVTVIIMDLATLDTRRVQRHGPILARERGISQN